MTVSLEYEHQVNDASVMCPRPSVKDAREVNTWHFQLLQWEMLSLLLKIHKVRKFYKISKFKGCEVTRMNTHIQYVSEKVGIGKKKAWRN